MNTKVTYQWCIEYYTADETEDITETNFSDDDQLTFDSTDFIAPDGEASRLCLVRFEGNEIDGETDRHYTYVKDGKLPEFFEDSFGHYIGIKVPQKYHKQFEKYKKLVTSFTF